MKISDIEKNSKKAEKLLKSVANGNRLMILCNLVEEPKTVTQLLEIIPLSQSALSQHLAKLRHEKILAHKKVGQRVYYSIKEENVKLILMTLHQIFCEQPKE